MDVWHYAPIKQQRRPAVQLTGHSTANCYQDSPLHPQQWPKPSPVLTASTHGEIARLSCLENTKMVYTPKVVTNPSTNRA